LGTGFGTEGCIWLGFAVAVLGTGLALRTGMLRITIQYRPGTVLRLEGRLQGPWVDELRNCWQRERTASGDQAIRIELVDVRFVDVAGKTLLSEMHRAGVEIVAQGCLMQAIRDEIVAGPADDPSETR